MAQQVCTAKAGAVAGRNDRFHDVADAILREQFTELIVPWGNTTAGPPTHPSRLLILLLNMEVNRGMMHV